MANLISAAPEKGQFCGLDNFFSFVSGLSCTEDECELRQIIVVCETVVKGFFFIRGKLF